MKHPTWHKIFDFLQSVHICLCAIPDYLITYLLSFLI